MPSHASSTTPTAPSAQVPFSALRYLFKPTTVSNFAVIRLAKK